MMSKTEYAFRATCKDLYQTFEDIYFWTFTMVEVMPDWWYGLTWNKFIVQLQKLYGGEIAGVKVVELHKDHGIHWHCLLNQRIWAGQVRRLGRGYGIGRVHVKRAKEEDIDYCAKYVSKQFEDPEKKIMSQLRRWGTIGFNPVQVRDVEIKSKFHDNMDIAKRIFGGQVPFLFTQFLMGPARVWPFEEIEKACVNYKLRGCLSAKTTYKP
jgi:hypothetical protein